MAKTRISWRLSPVKVALCVFAFGRSLKLQGGEELKKRITGKVTNQNVKVRKIDRKFKQRLHWLLTPMTTTTTTATLY